MTRLPVLGIVLFCAAAATAQEGAPATMPTTQASRPVIPTTQASRPVIPTTQASRPVIPTTQASRPVIPTTQASRPATTAPSEGDLLAAESLRYSAMSMVHARRGTRGRAGRLVALAGFAQRLIPDNPDTAWLLSNIYESRREPNAAADAMRTRLLADPNDYILGLNYMRTATGAMARPDEQEAFLRSMIDDSTYPDALRAQAAVELGRIFHANRQDAQALPLFQQARQLDPISSEAIDGMLAATDTKPTTEETARSLIGMLKGSPRATQLIRNLAALTSNVGLYQQSADLLGYVWQSATATGGGAMPPADLVGQYLNALLDAGRYDKAIEVFQPLAEETPDERGLQTMLVEAYRAVGDDAKADRVGQRLVEAIGKASQGEPSLQEIAEQAWLYIVVYPQPQLALERARRVAEAEANDPMAIRLLGAAELTSDQADVVSAGRDRLAKLAPRDVVSAALLAGHYAATGDAQAAGKVIPSVLEGARSGWPYRRVRDAAAKLGITLTPHPEAQAVEGAVQQLDKRYLQVAQSPEKHLSVSLRPTQEFFLPGQAVRVEAVLANTGDVPLPLGPTGLLNPTMSLEVAAQGAKAERFTDVPMVVWPAPKYLPPGGTVKATVRLDVGAVQYYLARHPLDEMTLTVTGTIDPIQQGSETKSSLPTVKVEPATITRRDLLGQFDRSSSQAWREAYEHGLRVIMTDLVRGSMERRMQAARQIGQLLTLVRDVQLLRVKLPEHLRGVVNKGVLLAMVKKALEDHAEAVRAEMLAALCDADLDDSIVAVISPAVDDPSPLVRMRMGELLGTAGVKGQQAAMKKLSGDGDEFVRQMAVAFEGSGVPTTMP